MNAPELLAPAGSMEMMRAAFAFGADAVYAGLPRYSLRVRNNAFRNVECLREGIAEAHAKGRKFFVVSNLLPHNAKVRSWGCGFFSWNGYNGAIAAAARTWNGSRAC